MRRARPLFPFVECSRMRFTNSRPLSGPPKNRTALIAQSCTSFESGDVFSSTHLVMSSAFSSRSQFCCQLAPPTEKWSMAYESGYARATARQGTVAFQETPSFSTTTRQLDVVETALRRHSASRLASSSSRHFAAVAATSAAVRATRRSAPTGGGGGGGAFFASRNAPSDDEPTPDMDRAVAAASARALDAFSFSSSSAVSRSILLTHGSR
mmetsp:Transcript_3885/g.16520  ORF Transcript_3885/g.16520 Transcript_3885/m.16520 type:complete len:211 (-) Transcript_3885:966-1598(-)